MLKTPPTPIFAALPQEKFSKAHLMKRFGKFLPEKISENTPVSFVRNFRPFTESGNLPAPLKSDFSTEDQATPKICRKLDSAHGEFFKLVEFLRVFST